MPDHLVPTSRRRSGGAFVLVYVVPVALTAALLAAAGLTVMALALVGIELFMVTAVALARRPPKQRSSAPRPRSGSSVVLVLGASIVVAVLAVGLLLRATT